MASRLAFAFLASRLAFAFLASRLAFAFLASKLASSWKLKETRMIASTPCPPPLPALPRPRIPHADQQLITNHVRVMPHISCKQTRKWL